MAQRAARVSPDPYDWHRDMIAIARTAS